MTGSSKDPRFLPVTALLIGATMWGVVWYPMRLLENSGLDGLWLTLLIYLPALLASLPRTGGRFREIKTAPDIILPILFSAGWTNIAFVLAVLEGNVMRVLLLFYLSPIWATILGAVFLKERISIWGWTRLAVAMAGAVFMLWTPELGMPWPQHASDWFAITSGIAFAVSNFFVRKGQHVSLEAKLGASWLGVVLMSIVLIVWQQSPIPVITPYNLAGAAAVGIFGILVMTTSVQYGVTHLPVHLSAVILLFELVAGAVSQQLLTDEQMSFTEWAGGACIIMAAYFSSRGLAIPKNGATHSN